MYFQLTFRTVGHGFNAVRPTAVISTRKRRIERRIVCWHSLSDKLCYFGIFVFVFDFFVFVFNRFLFFRFSFVFVFIILSFSFSLTKITLEFNSPESG